MNDPVIGRTLAGYLVNELLAPSRIGTIYRASQLSVARSVALKVLGPRLANDRKLLVAFLQAARAAGRLNHRGIVQVHEVCQDGEYVFYSMEYLAGGSLAKALEERPRVPFPRAFRIFKDAVKALQYAAQHRILHGSLHPGHLLLTPGGRLKLLNLGIASALPALEHPELAPTPAELRYMPLEQILDGQTDQRADIHALGCVFYQALSGRPPFPGSTRDEILDAKKRCGRLSLSEVSHEAPAWFSALVERMTARRPEDRFRSAAEVAAALNSRPRSRRWLAPAAASSKGAGEEASGRSAPVRKLALPAVAAILLLGLLVAVFLPGSWRADDGSAPAAAPPASAWNELDAIEEGVRLERVGRAQALGDLDRLLAATLDEDLERRGREVRRQIQAELRKEEEDELSRAREQAREALAAGRYRDAILVLEEAKARVPGRAGDLGLELEKVGEAAARELSQAEEQADVHLRRGALAEARATIQDVTPKLPEALVERARRKLAVVDEAETLEAALATAGGEAVLLIRGRDFRGAETVLSRLPGGAGVERYRASRDRLREEIRQCEETWSKLEALSLPDWAARAASRVESIPTENGIPTGNGLPANGGIPTQGRPDFFRQFRAAALEAAVGIRAAALEAEGYVGFFHGEARAAGDAVEVTYNFLEVKELKDFVAVPSAGDGGSLGIEGGKLSVRGEHRLLDGNPFRARLEVSMLAADFHRKAPNLNLAFWTSEKDAVTYSRGDPGSRSDSGSRAGSGAPGLEAAGPLDEMRAGAGGYVVFALGYSPAEPVQEFLSVTESAYPLYFPCRAVIPGVRGRPLHGLSRWDALWGEKFKPLGAPQEVAVALRPDAVEWSAGGARLQRKPGAEILAKLRGHLGENPAGSLTLFTNGELVILESLKVTGELDPDWRQAKLRQSALRELKRRAPELSWQEIERG